jgi:hypothetical protein
MEIKLVCEWLNYSFFISLFFLTNSTPDFPSSLPLIEAAVVA